MKKNTKNKIINVFIYYGTFLFEVCIVVSAGALWFWIMGERIESYGWGLKILVGGGPILLVAIIAFYIHELLENKYYRDEE